MGPKGSFAKVLVQDTPGHLQIFFDHASTGQSSFGRMRRALSLYYGWSVYMFSTFLEIVVEWLTIYSSPLIDWWLKTFPGSTLALTQCQLGQTLAEKVGITDGSFYHDMYLSVLIKILKLSDTLILLGNRTCFSPWLSAASMLTILDTLIHVEVPFWRDLEKGSDVTKQTPFLMQLPMLCCVYLLSKLMLSFQNIPFSFIQIHTHTHTHKYSSISTMPVHKI